MGFGHPKTTFAKQFTIRGVMISSFCKNIGIHMNKKLVAWVFVAVVAGILLLWTLLRHSLFGQSHNLANDTIGVMLALLALPMRLYVIFISGENGHWSLPVLILFLGLSGLMWGLIVERIVWMFSKRKTAK